MIFRGQPHQAYGGWSVNIPQHSFKNNSDKPARLLCMCAPSGQEKFFVPAGDARPPKLSKAEQAERRTTAKALSPSIEPGRRYEGPGLVSCAPRVIRSEDDSPIQLRFIEGGIIPTIPQAKELAIIRRGGAADVARNISIVFCNPLKRTGD